MPMKKPAQHFIAEVPRSITKVGMTLGIDFGDVWSHYCTLNEDGEVVGRGRFRTSPSGVEKWFTDLPRVLYGTVKIDRAFQKRAERHVRSIIKFLIQLDEVAAYLK